MGMVAKPSRNFILRLRDMPGREDHDATAPQVDLDSAYLHAALDRAGHGLLDVALCELGGGHWSGSPIWQ